MKISVRTISDCKKMRGFTIIEVLIGLCVLSVGLLAVGVMQTAAVRNNRTGNTFSQASALARSQMEIIKDGDMADTAGILNPAAFPTTTNDLNNPMDENGQPGGIYNRSWTVGDYLEDTDSDGIGDTASPFARTVTVTVLFPFPGRGTRQVTLTSVTAGSGL